MKRESNCYGFQNGLVTCFTEVQNDFFLLYLDNFEYPILADFKKKNLKKLYLFYQIINSKLKVK